MTRTKRLKDKGVLQLGDLDLLKGFDWTRHIWNSEFIGLRLH
jgi:hypothetical protein